MREGARRPAPALRRPPGAGAPGHGAECRRAADHRRRIGGICCVRYASCVALAASCCGRCRGCQSRRCCCCCQGMPRRPSHGSTGPSSAGCSGSGAGDRPACRHGAGRPVVFVSNHSSWLDVPVLGGRLDACFVAKDEVGRWPLVGTIARLGRTVFISRQRGATGAMSATRCADASLPATT